MVTFRQAIPRFCTKGQRWARQQPNLSTAWRRCRKGGWLAWWLIEYRGVSLSALEKLAEQCSTRVFYACDDESQRVFATLIRQHYTMHGARRVVRDAR